MNSEEQRTDECNEVVLPTNAKQSKRKGNRLRGVKAVCKDGIPTVPLGTSDTEPRNSNIESVDSSSTQADMAQRSQKPKPLKRKCQGYERSL